MQTRHNVIHRVDFPNSVFFLFSSGRTVTTRNWPSRLVHMRVVSYATNSCGHAESIAVTIIISLENNIADLKVDLENRAKVPQLRFFRLKSHSCRKDLLPSLWIERWVAHVVGKHWFSLDIPPGHHSLQIDNFFYFAKRSENTTHSPSYVIFRCRLTTFLTNIHTNATFLCRFEPPYYWGIH